ncbi:MAG: helix-turn-helix domain-containing protein, partial [Candidatus Lokiarchaeota archaeon]|nr:helix-turn-helix domain-containing protein [Candidatus Lokiarchaeota archaeon]
FLYSYSLIIVMKLTQKIRIIPSKEQKHVLWILSEKYRLLYNFALAERIENCQQNITTNSYRINPLWTRNHSYHIGRVFYDIQTNPY